MLPASEALPVFQTVEEFERWERLHPSKGNYEFVRGRIIEKEATKQLEAFIIKFLARLFTQTAAYERGDELLQEMDSYVDEVRRRRPDLAVFTTEQIDLMRNKTHVSTAFAIEILSDSETHEEVLEKIQDYFDGGTQLVWYITPKRRKIYVYTSPDESKAYKGSDVISAAPVVPDFQFVVGELFA